MNDLGYGLVLFEETWSSDPDNDTDTLRSSTSRRQSASNVTTAILVKPTIHTKINLDELPYDLADWKRISEYTRNPKKQDKIRRNLVWGSYRTTSNFGYPQREIGDTQRRFNPVFNLRCGERYIFYHYQ